MWGAINELKVQRIDHGIHSLEDPALVRYMAQHKLPITLCPISNKQLQVSSGREGCVKGSQNPGSASLPLQVFLVGEGGY